MFGLFKRNLNKKHSKTMHQDNSIKIDIKSIQGIYQEHLVFLSKMLEGGTRANFAGANLKGIKFCDIGFEDASINLFSEGTNVMLDGANFRESNLERADFGGVSLDGANFENSNLKDANLKNASLCGANFKGAVLKGTNLEGADFSDAENLTLQQVREAANWDKAENIPESDFETAKDNEEPNGFQNDIVIDIDGNKYKTVKIGNQCWMAENLRVKHFRNGETIPQISDADEWENTTSGAYCIYDNDPSNADIYGFLYNFQAATDNRCIAPEGWHIPTDEEWEILVNYLGGENVAGGKMKESGTSNWKHQNVKASNKSGFTALPGGMCNNSGNSRYINTTAYFWSSSKTDDDFAWLRELSDNVSSIGRNACKGQGCSIRCIKD